jgi:ammonia channel protein AmtB
VIGSYILLKIVDLAIGLRVTDEEEIRGLDLSQHGEDGYALDFDLKHTGEPAVGSFAEASTP